MATFSSDEPDGHFHLSKGKNFEQKLFCGQIHKEKLNMASVGFFFLNNLQSAAFVYQLNSLSCQCRHIGIVVLAPRLGPLFTLGSPWKAFPPVLYCPSCLPVFIFFLQ